MITIKTFKSHKQQKVGAQIALSNRLFVPGWNLFWALKDIVYIKKHPNDKLILIAYNNDVPIGIAYVFTYSKKHYIQLFVRKAERRNGVGKALWNKAQITLNHKNDFRYHEGGQDSQKFFPKITKGK
tara:strand:- start:868 stop:1248 length:381 start_codon:yes stop_codon:yes gene_type:complete